MWGAAGQGSWDADGGIRNHQTPGRQLSIRSPRVSHLNLPTAWRGKPRLALPRDPSGFHVIGQGNIMWPHVILPLLQTNHPAEDIARMHSHAHVDIHSGGVPHFPEEKEKSITIWKHPPLPLTPGQVSGHRVTQNFSDCWKQSGLPPVAEDCCSRPWERSFLSGCFQTRPRALWPWLRLPGQAGPLVLMQHFSCSFDFFSKCVLSENYQLLTPAANCHTRVTWHWQKQTETPSTILALSTMHVPREYFLLRRDRRRICEPNDISLSRNFSKKVTMSLKHFIVHSHPQKQ